MVGNIYTLTYIQSYIHTALHKYSLTYTHYTKKKCTVSNQDKILILHSGKGGITIAECNATLSTCTVAVM